MDENFEHESVFSILFGYHAYLLLFTAIFALILGLPSFVILLLPQDFPFWTWAVVGLVHVIPSGIIAEKLTAKMFSETEETRLTFVNRFYWQIFLTFLVAGLWFVFTLFGLKFYDAAMVGSSLCFPIYYLAFALILALAYVKKIYR